MVVSLTWTSEIGEGEARILVQTIAMGIMRVGQRVGPWLQSQALPTITPYGDWVILAMPHGSAYSSLDWYLDHCRTPDANRLDGPAYLRLVQMEPWQSSDLHFDVALVGQDLVNSDGESVLNVALPGLAAVASLHHLEQLKGEAVHERSLRHLVAHVWGRAVGIPLPTRASGVAARGEHLYCANLCAMRPCTQLRELLEYSAEGTPSHPYCQACERDLEAALISSHYGMQ